ncbi:hypothetical protein J4E89_009035 [Alternaria sp. Ai002NY15]|nr:hypothetical protein J4E89_009035 [Alternaria sp. Ai002NY15]
MAPQTLQDSGIVSVPTTRAPPKLQENGVLSLEDTPGETKKIIDQNDAQSPLLKLPAEIRNRIARLACETETGFVWFLDDNGHIVTSSKFREAVSANPLNAVCKMLRAETKWLEIKMHKIKVESQAFVRMHTDKDLRLRQIKCGIEIAIIHQGEFMIENRRRQAIFEYAKANPDIKIVVRITNWKVASAMIPLQYFVCLGWAMEKTLRGKKRKFTGCTKAFASWEDGKAKEDLDLPNLRFFPSMVFFGEDTFRRNMNNGEERTFVKKLLKQYGSEDAVVEAMNVWFEEGI